MCRDPHPKINSLNYLMCHLTYCQAHGPSLRYSSQKVTPEPSRSNLKNFFADANIRMDNHKSAILEVFSHDSDLTTSVVRPYVRASVRLIP